MTIQNINQIQVDPGLIGNLTSNINLPGSGLIPAEEETQVIEETQAQPITEEQKQRKSDLLAGAVESSEEAVSLLNQIDTSISQILSKGTITAEDAIALESLRSLRSQEQTKKTLVDQAIAKDAEDEGFFTLERLEKYLTLAGLGMLTMESADKIFGGNDIDPIDVDAELDKATEAVTDPARADKIITASYRDQPRLSDLESLSAYNNQFGSLSSEYFNSDFGPELEQAYQAMFANNPDLNRDQFLVEFARANPTNPISQDINYRLSRMGQLTRSTGELADLDRNLIRTGLGEASRFYQPTDQGGYGFTPDQFRTPEQRSLVDKAMASTDGLDMLQESIGRRVKNQGRLETDEVRDITSRALTSVDPSLSGQAYLRNGGIGRSVLNNSREQMGRLNQAENSLGNVIGLKSQNLATANNIVGTNTLDPAKAFGLTSGNTNLADQIYQTNPTQGQKYNPYGSYFSSITGLNANIDQANMIGNSQGQNVIDLKDNLSEFNKALGG